MSGISQNHSSEKPYSTVFSIDDILFNHTICKKTELGSKVFDHTNMPKRTIKKSSHFLTTLNMVPQILIFLFSSFLRMANPLLPTHPYRYKL